MDFNINNNTYTNLQFNSLSSANTLSFPLHFHFGVRHCPRVTGMKVLERRTSTLSNVTRYSEMIETSSQQLFANGRIPGHLVQRKTLNENLETLLVVSLHPRAKLLATIGCCCVDNCALYFPDYVLAFGVCRDLLQATVPHPS